MIPKCNRCGSVAVYIGIGPAAELACKYDCEGRCPKCFSSDVEPFVTWSYFGVQQDAKDSGTFHCADCGAVFEQDGSIKRYDRCDEG